MERLDRGAVAMAAADGRVYAGWRLLASDPPGIGFDVLRSIGRDGSWEKLTVEAITNFIIKQPAGSIDPGSPRRSPDTYKIEPYNRKTGGFMWRYDLGWNINMGIWFSPMVVYDLDGDGRAEVVSKWLHPLRAREQVSGMRRKGHAGIGRDSVCLGGSR